MMLENFRDQLIATRGARIVLGKAYSEGKLAGLASIVSAGDLVSNLGNKLASSKKTGLMCFSVFRERVKNQDRQPYQVEWF